MSKFLNNNLDFWGFLASFLCALHCAAIPMILMFSSLGSFAWIASHEVELVFIILSIGLAYWSLWTSYRKHHKKKKAINIAFIGFGFLLLSRIIPHHIGEILVVIGGLLIAYAHIVNWQLLQTCKHCTHASSNKKKKPAKKEDEIKLKFEEVY